MKKDKETFVSKPKIVSASDKRVNAHREEIQKVVRPLVQEQEKRHIYAYKVAHTRTVP